MIARTSPKIGIRRSRVNILVLILIYRASLDIAYILWISPYLSYMRLELLFRSVWVVALSCFLVIVTGAIIPLKSSPSKFVVGFIYIVSYIPVTTLFAWGGFPIQPVLWLTLGFLFLFYISRKRFRVKLKLPVTRTWGPLFFVVLGFYVGGMLLLISQYGFRMPSAIFDVYGTRLEYKGLGSSRLLSYALIWQGSIIIPFVVAWALTRRKLIILLAAIATQLAVFAIAGFKSHFFVIVLVSWMLFGVRFFRFKLLSYSLCSAILGICLIGLIDSLCAVPTLNLIFTRRLLFLPAQLYYFYYDFFSKNPHTYLSQSIILKWLFEYPYNLQIPELISINYFPRSSHANANIWADAYANFGIAGIFVFPALLRIVLHGIDNIAEGKDAYLVYALLAMCLFSLTNSAFFTTLLTHGMLLSILLMMFIPRTKIVCPQMLPVEIDNS